MLSARRPKILHIVVGGQIGGAENFVVDLAGRPEESGADHSLALWTPNPKLRAFFKDAGLQVHDYGYASEAPLPYLWRTYGPRDIAWLGRVIEQERPDVLHCHTYGSLVLAARAGKRFGVPVLRTEHGVRHYYDPSCALHRHWALRHTDRVVAVSAFTARKVAEVAPFAKAKTTVVLNATNLERFTPMPPPKEGPFTITSVCRLVSTKRLWMAIEATARIPDIRLDIVGDGPDRAKLESVAKKFGVESRVRFHGYVTDARPLIAAGDAFINCRREEPFGIAVIEAAAMQRPIIAFAGGGIPEFIEDRKTGWLVQEDSIDALTETMREASRSRARAAEFGANACEMAHPKFGIARLCNEYGSAYRQVLAERDAAARHALQPDLLGRMSCPAE